MYDLLNIIAVVCVLFFNFSNFKNHRDHLSKVSLFLLKAYKKQNNSKLKNILTAFEIIIISAIQYLPAAILNRSFGDAVGTGSNYFGLILFIPFILLAFFYLISTNPFKQLDLIAPAYPLALIFVKLGCFCSGCCNGIESEFGFYNYDTGLVEFPSQLLEAGLGLLLFIFMMIYRKKAKEGTLYPVYLFLYSFTRFFSEFTRSEPEVFWILKKYHILCLVGMVVGIILLFIVLYLKEDIGIAYDKAYIFVNKKVEEFAKSYMKKHSVNQKQVHNNKSKNKKNKQRR